MENLQQGVPQVCVYIDDNLVMGSTMKKHLHHLDEVLCRLERAGMRLKKGKCICLMPEMEYLGHRISSQGLQPSEPKSQSYFGHHFVIVFYHKPLMHIFHMSKAIPT